MWPRDPARGAFLRRSRTFPPFPLRESHGNVCKMVEFYRILRDLPGFDGFLMIFDMVFCVGFMICFFSWDMRFIGFQWVFDQILWSVEWDINGIIGFTIKHIPRKLKHHCWILYVDYIWDTLVSYFLVVLFLTQLLIRNRVFPMAHFDKG